MRYLWLILVACLFVVACDKSEPMSRPVTKPSADKSSLFELQHLAIGKIAPDIEGEDFDGTKFKLSEYRGKVVVIDFWGDW